MRHARPHSNLAARMGRWSAHHWKTATFGWLAFVVVAFGLGGLVGVKNVDPGAAGPGESGHMNRILDAGFSRPANESVLIQSRTATAGTPAFDAAVDDVVARVSRVAVVPAPPARRGLEGRALGARRLQRQRRQGQGLGQDPAGDRRGRRRARRPSGLLHRRVRRRERAEGRREGVRGRPRQGRAALAADHAGHPRARVRRARGGGDPAAARADRHPGHVRADRAAEPSDPGRLRGAGDGAPDRARGRRRLLDVLLEAPAAGAGGGTQQRGRARGRRGDLRPLGADLRLDGDGCDGRHVPDRRPDLRLARLRDDPRRRRRGARLADGAPRGALAARRQRRPAARPVRRATRPRRRRGPDLGRDRRPCPAPAGPFGGARGRRAGGARPAGAAADPRAAGRRVVPAVARA